jgi:hypothetical protein
LVDVALTVGDGLLLVVIPEGLGDAALGDAALGELVPGRVVAQNAPVYPDTTAPATARILKQYWMDPPRPVIWKAVSCADGEPVMSDQPVPACCWIWNPVSVAFGLHPESLAVGEITDQIATTADELSAVALGLRGGHGGSDVVGVAEAVGLLGVDEPVGNGVGVNFSLPDAEPVGATVWLPLESGPGASVGPGKLPLAVPDSVGAPEAEPPAVPGVVTHACGLNIDCADPATAMIR